MLTPGYSTNKYQQYGSRSCWFSLSGKYIVKVQMGPSYENMPDPNFGCALNSTEYNTRCCLIQV